MNRVVISHQNWHMALANAIADSTPDTVIVVHNENERELAIRAASRMKKTVTVEIASE